MRFICNSWNGKLIAKQVLLGMAMASVNSGEPGLVLRGESLAVRKVRQKNVSNCDGIIAHHRARYVSIGEQMCSTTRTLSPRVTISDVICAQLRYLAVLRSGEQCWEWI